MPGVSLLAMLLMGLTLSDGVETAPGPWDDLGEEDLALIMREGAAWIAEQRDLHNPAARPLDRHERRAFATFFEPELLDSARVLRVERIENPGFYSFFEEAGKPIPIDFTRASGIALLDTILVVESRVPSDGPSWLPLIFHELVHLAQYRHLGLPAYIERYVGGWTENGFSYRAIPLEDQAYDLAERYGRASGRGFSVEAEVRRLFPRR